MKLHTGTKLLVVGVSTIAAAAAFLITHRRRRRTSTTTQSASAQENVPGSHSLFTAATGVTLGHIVKYIPRAVMIPVLISSTAREPTAFIVVDDLACAPHALSEALRKGDVASFLEAYPKQCPFLSRANDSAASTAHHGGHAAFLSLEREAGPFRYIMSTETFTALLMIDADKGIAATLVVLGANCGAVGINTAAKLVYGGPRKYNDAQFNAGVSFFTPSAAWTPTRDALQQLGNETPPATIDGTQDQTPRHVTYVNRTLGFQFDVPATQERRAVFTNRITDDDLVVYEQYGSGSSETEVVCRLTIQRTKVPVEWSQDDDTFTRGVLAEYTDQRLKEGDASCLAIPVQLKLFAGRRAAVFEQQTTSLWSKTFVVCTGGSKGDSASPVNALVVQWEGSCGVGPNNHKALLANFLDTFFFL